MESNPPYLHDSTFATSYLKPRERALYALGILNREEEALTAFLPGVPGYLYSLGIQGMTGGCIVGPDIKSAQYIFSD